MRALLNASHIAWVATVNTSAGQALSKQGCGKVSFFGRVQYKKKAISTT